MTSFNPRPREGATYRVGADIGAMGCFNPRPREGATRRYRAHAAGLAVSIHAPVKGRPGRTFLGLMLAKFQSTPP